MMFKFLTVVVRVCIICLLATTFLCATTSPTWAGTKKEEDEEESSNNSYNECDEVSRKMLDPVNPLIYEKANAGQKRIMDRCDSNSNDTSDCRSAESDYNKALGKLKEACDIMGSPPAPKDEPVGWPSCTKAMAQCTECADSSSANSDRRDTLQCSNVDIVEEEDSTDKAQKFFGLKNIETGKALLAYCSGKLGAEQEKLEKDRQEFQKNVQELEKKLPKLQSEYSEILENTETSMSEVQGQMTEAQNQFDQQMEELQASQEDANKKMTDRIVELQQKIAETDDKMRQVQLSKTDAENAYSEAIKQIELQCHASASMTVSKYQEERLALERTKKFNRGGFKNMLSQVGLSDRDAWQRVAEKYYKWCLQSTPTKKSKDSALKAKIATIARADEAIKTLEGQKAQLGAMIGRVKSQGCASPSGEETEQCRSIRMAAQSAQRLTRQYNNSMQTLNRKLASAQSSGTQKAQAKLAEAKVVQQQLNDERLRLDNLQEYLELAYASGKGGSPPGAEDFAKARERLADFESAAYLLVGCNTKGDCARPGSACNVAAAYLINMGQEPIYKKELQDAVGVPPLTPALVPTQTIPLDPWVQKHIKEQETKRINPDATN